MSKVDEINQAMLRATHHRDQLIQLAKGFVALHDEQPGSCEADELMHVILDGEEYDLAMRRVMRIKQYRKKHKRDA